MKYNVKIIIGVIAVLLILLISAIYYITQNQGYEEIQDLAIEEISTNTIANQTDTNQTIAEEEKKEIVVHITGEVKHKGIIYLEEGQRIKDAIEKAGGATKNANLDAVNLAYVLEDGQKIYIPNKNEKNQTKAYITTDSGQNVIVEGNNKTSKSAGDKVNINTANQTELETLPGIGPSIAQGIVEYRETNGKFNKIEDIQNVKGIGDAKYSNIKDKISI